MVEMFAISTRACASILYCGGSTLTPSKDYYLAGEERERERFPIARSSLIIVKTDRYLGNIYLSKTPIISFI